jgi:predicted transcriptional regulator
MATAKEQIGRLLDQQPDDSSVEEIVWELAFGLMIDRGVRDSDAGRTISNEEMRHRIRQWRK